MSGFEEKIKGNLKQLLTSFYNETVGEELKAAVKALINDKKYNKEMEAYKNQHDDFDYDFGSVSVFLYECVLNGRFKRIFDKSDDEDEMQALYNDAIAYANCAGNREEEEKVKKYCNHIYSFFKRELKSTYSDGDSSFLNRQDYIAHTVRDTSKDVKDIKDKICEKKEPKYNTSNDIYINSFKTPLFLHKKNLEVVLSNLFVFQKYNNGKDDLQERLGNFIQSDSHVLIIEGDAGNGKSSLVGWMNYHYALNDDDSKNMFGDKKLVTIRLRDLNKELIKENFCEALFEYTKTHDPDEFETVFENSVVVLDGYDELCMILGGTEYSLKDSMLEELLECFYDSLKFIITSRPHYINKNSLRIEYDSIYLNHFDEDKRNEWITAYRDKCHQTIDPNVLDFIEHIDENDAEGVCDTPFSLYMLAANREMSEQVLNNSWALYHNIFYSAISETPYNEIYSRIKKKHSISKYKETIYQINEEIAYEMYKNNSKSESVFFLKDSKVKEIVRRVAEKNCTDEDVKNLTEGSFALCCYWKNDAKDGAIEFYHNNIRDFFVCEKIFREINKLYDSVSSDELSDEEIQTFIDKFCELFLYGGLADKVTEFIGLRTEYGIKNNKNDFPKAEQKKIYLPQFFEAMLTNGGRMKCVNSNNPIQEIINTLRCIAQVYRSVYRRYLNENEKIHWWNSVDNVNRNGMLRYVFKPVFGAEVYLSGCSSDFRGVDLENCDLSHIILTNSAFSNSDLSGSDLNNSVLYKVELIHAYLINANLQEAYLEEIDLRGAYLKGTNLQKAYLQEADLRYANLQGANLQGANLQKADLQGADLRGADLENADLYGAHLDDVDLSMAILDNTILPNGEISCKESDDKNGGSQK
ncbi:MAG: pentapeptide repeat-containing protein [Ruminococcus bromii]|nr:pentapeptide repeat-containing protein [Ruminococcus bromii]